jgi:hypothetical protein
MKTKSILFFIAILSCIISCEQEKKNSMNKKSDSFNNISIQSDSIISEQKAIKIATDDAHGFLGTWVTTEYKDEYWHIKASSKSANPPKYYIIDARKGNIVLKFDNSDLPENKKKLKEFLLSIEHK